MKMTFRRWLAVSVLIGPALCLAHSDTGEKAKCRKIKEEIRLVQAKMRSGYTRAQGEKLAAKLRQLRKVRSKTCR